MKLPGKPVRLLVKAESLQVKAGRIAGKNLSAAGQSLVGLLVSW